MSPAPRSWLRPLAALAAGLVVALSMAAAEPQRLPELGNPFIRNYTPKEFGGDAQNWSVVQDGRGLIYAANNQGVLEYDGARWRLIRTPHRTVVRSLAVDAKGRVYVGAVGEIGYLAPDELGRARFVSVADKVEPADQTFSDVWATCATPQGVLFQSREKLFLLNDGRIQVWKAATTFHVAFTVQGRIFVRQRGVGLVELAQGKLVLLPGGERFANESVFAMLPLGAPGQGILIGSRKLGLWRYDGNAILPFPSEVDAFLKDNALYNGTQLGDGTLALATITGGVVFMDRDGRMRGLLDRASGLQGDNVKFLYPDRQSSLWMALDNGVSKVEWPSPLSIFDERLGLKGTVWAMQRHQGSLYVATGQGAFLLDAQAQRPRFRPLEGVKTQSLAFLSLGDTLLLANAQGVFEIQGDQGRPIRPSSNVAISLHRSKADPDRVFVGLQGGLASLHRKPGSKAWVDEGLIPGVSDDIYAMAEDGTGRLWLGLGGQGVQRISFPSGWQGGASPQPEVQRFGPEQGLPDTIQTYPVSLTGGMVFTSHLGIYRCDEGTERFSVDPRFSQLFPEGPRSVKALVEDARGRIWMDSIDEQRGIHETGEAIPQKGGAYRWDPAPLRRFAEAAVEAIHADPEGVLWFGGPAGIFRYDASVPRPRTHLFPTLLRRVTSRSGQLLFGGDLQDAPERPAKPALRFAENAPRFEFSSPFFDQESANQYQVILEGYDKDWSPWTEEAQKEYTNLRERNYRFRVRSRNVYGQVGEEAVYPFKVLPPWYRSWWAYLGYLGLASLALVLAFQARTRLLRERNILLHARIAEATMELQELNAQKNQYLGIVAHDLRNPLHGILLSAEMIEETGSLEESRRLAQNISRVSEDMSLLIGRFLDIAAIDSGGIKAESELFPLNELATEILDAYAARARAKDLRLRTELAEGAGEVFADSRFMKGVLENLISNAIKFSPPGKEILLRLEPVGEKLILSVIDQGPGLNASDKEKLFSRFARLSAKPTAGEGSVGLGLSIIKHMLDAMGGRIWVESEPGQGAAFRVELPTKAPDGYFRPSTR